MKKIISSIIVASASVFGLPALAFDVPLNQHLDNYVEINAGTNLYYWGVITSQGHSSGAGIRGLGWNVALGHYIVPCFGLEAGFMQNYFEANINNDNTSHLNIPYATTRFNVPINDRFSFIGKIGFGYAFSGSDGALIPYTGVGFSYAMNKNIDITTQYQGIVLGIAGAGLLSLGITYHF